MAPNEGAAIHSDPDDAGTTVITFKIKTVVLGAVLLAVFGGGISGGFGHFLNNTVGAGVTEARAAEGTASDTSAIKGEVQEIKQTVADMARNVEDTNDELRTQGRDQKEFQGYMRAHLENLERRIIKEVEAERGKLRDELQAEIERLEDQMKGGSNP